MFTKSGIMVGLGEERNEVLQLMDDLRSADVDFLTIGQYLAPSRSTGDPLRDAGRVQVLRDDRRRQGFPPGVVEPADALLAPCRRGFRTAARGPERQARLMPDLFFERHVPHLPERMFDLVSDLEAYPRFLPNVTAMDVMRDSGTRDDVRYARMTLRFGPVTQAYTSRVVTDPAARTIAARAVDGPFEYLDSKWSFEPEGQGTRVRFDIDFKISNPLIRAVAEPAFAQKQEGDHRGFHTRPTDGMEAEKLQSPHLPPCGGGGAA